MPVNLWEGGMAIGSASPNKNVWLLSCREDCGLCAYVS